jgi:hypothetical protein
MSVSYSALAGAPKAALGEVLDVPLGVQKPTRIELKKPLLSRALGSSPTVFVDDGVLRQDDGMWQY